MQEARTREGEPPREDERGTMSDLFHETLDKERFALKNAEQAVADAALSSRNTEEEAQYMRDLLDADVCRTRIGMYEKLITLTRDRKDVRISGDVWFYIEQTIADVAYTYKAPQHSLEFPKEDSHVRQSTYRLALMTVATFIRSL